MSIVEQFINHPFLGTIEKVAKISGIFYLLGMFSLNVTYYLYGFHDFDVSVPQVIYAGVWVLIYVALSCAPASTIAKNSKKYGSKLTPIIAKISEEYGSKLSRPGWIAILFLLSSGLVFMAYEFRYSIGYFIKAHYLGYLLGVLAVMTIGTGALLSTLAPELSKQLYSKKADTGTTVITTSLMLLCIVAIAVLFSVFHSMIPLAFGGGKSEQIDIWVAKDQLDIFNNCGGPPKINYKTAGDATLIPNLFVLHETKDNFIIWRQTCPTIAIPRTSVKSYQWAQPQYK